MITLNDYISEYIEESNHAFAVNGSRKWYNQISILKFVEVTYEQMESGS